MIVATRGGALRPTEPGVRVHPGGAEPREVATIGLGGRGRAAVAARPGRTPPRGSTATPSRPGGRIPTDGPGAAPPARPPGRDASRPPFPRPTTRHRRRPRAPAARAGRTPAPSAGSRPPSAVRDAIGRRQRRSRIEGDPAIGIERRPALPHRTEALAENRTAAWWRLDVAPDERSGPRATGHRRTAPDDPVRRWRAVAPTVRTRVGRWARRGGRCSGTGGAPGRARSSERARAPPPPGAHPRPRNRPAIRIPVCAVPSPPTPNSPQRAATR